MMPRMSSQVFIAVLLYKSHPKSLNIVPRKPHFVRSMAVASAPAPLDSSAAGVLQRLTAVEVELRNLKDENKAQHEEVGRKIDNVAESVTHLADSLTKGPDSHEGRLRILEALGNKGLAIIAIVSVVFGALVSMLFGWIRNPFAKH